MAAVAWLVAIRAVGIVAMGSVAVYALLNRDSPGALSLSVLGTGSVVWLVSETGLLFADSTSEQLVLLTLIYTGVMMVVAAWGFFAIEFTGFDGRYASVAKWGLLGYVVIDTVLIWGNPIHGEFIESIEPATSFWGMRETLGVAFYAHIALSYTVVLFGIILLLLLLYRSQALYEEQVYGLVAAMTVPWGTDIAYQLSLISIELTPLGITIGGLLLATTVFRFKFMEFSPVTQDTIIENIRDGVVVIDREQTVVDVNERAATLFGSNPDEMVGSHIDEFLNRIPAFEQAVGGFESASSVEEFDFAQDDRYFTVQPAVLEDHNERIVGCQYLIHEVTEQRRYQELLEQQNEQLDEFASVVSHDLRNPLEVAISNLELTRTSDDISRLDAVADAHERMQSLIDEMLDLTRHGQRVTDTTCLSMDGVAREAWQNVDSPAAELTVTDSLDIRADHDRLLQLFENLFRNAVQHAGEDVTVTVGPLDGGFFVADDGPGIPPANRDSIFDSNMTTAEDGTGLGLFIVDSIVTAHEWSIAVSESDAGGARFEIRGVDTCDRSTETQDSEAAKTPWQSKEWVAGSDS